MIQATKPTFSFGVLLLIAIGLVGAVYYLNQQMGKNNMLQLPLAPQHKSLATSKPLDKDRKVSTEDWKEYTSDDLAVSFKYPEKWQVKTYARDDFDIIVLTPDQGKDNIRIYISGDEYVGLAGVKTTTIKVGGKTGVNADDMVVGVKEGANYFTFDAGQDQELLPEFQGLITTVAFK